MTSKRHYIKPEVILVSLDQSINLMMKSHPKPPRPRRSGSKGTDEPTFESPFRDKPFS